MAEGRKFKVINGRIIFDDSIETVATNGKELVTTVNKERVVMVLDSSGSMQSLWSNKTRQLAAAEAAACLAKRSSPAFTKLGLIQFSHYAETVIAPTADMLMVADMCHPPAIGETTNYSAALSAAAELNPNRIVFLSDGAPTDGVDGILSICQTYKDLGIKIDTIAIGEQDRFNGSVLQQMSKITGGVYTYCKSPEELTAHFAKLETRARLLLEHKEAC